MRAWLREFRDGLTRRLANQLRVDGDAARGREDERYRQRQGEVSALIERSTLARLTREIEQLRERGRQGQLFDEADRLAEMERSIEEKQEELARRQRHYEDIREQLQRERTRILEHLLPARFAMPVFLDDGQRLGVGRGRRIVSQVLGWPRVLALFRLVRDGSHHPDLPVTAYGGDLFAAGAPDGPDGLSRALHVFESACFEDEVLADGEVHEMLKLLTRTTIHIRQGRGGTRAVVPVDFSDLSSEYIGILYEGLLDYELKTAPRGDPVIFLSVGDQPALPLSRLEAMEDRALKTLFERLKEGSPADDDAPDGADAGESSDESTEPALEAGTEPRGRGGADLFDGPEGHDEEVEGETLPLGVREASPEYLAAGSDQRQHSRTRAEAWARHAVEVARLVRNPRGRDTPERRLEFERRLGAKARQLVARVVLPGEWYLVRWGGNRKGSGSFYTRPGLAVPTVQRTLRPLAFRPPAGSDGTPDVNAHPARWTPKLPEEILSLTVCDPACGSGTFPLAALRFLTDALYASLQHHGRIEPDGERALVRLLGLRGNGIVSEEARAGSPSQGEGTGAPAELGIGDELIPCPPDDDRFEPRLKAVLRRHVVERCLYAVDLDPLTVELCRLSLWIETMDRTLPFGFLDHKVKCGNALIGAWFDQFRHYPVMAWKNREGGDKNHTNGVHFEQDARTKAIKAFVKDRLKPDFELFLQGADLYQEDLLEESLTVHEEALAVLAAMHALPVQDAAERARIYRERLLGSPAWRSLKRAMDLWCACWFWPAEEIEWAPLPSTLVDPPEETSAVAERVAAKMRFFHWELEFPDVFHEAGSGFDAILGNPPWDIASRLRPRFYDWQLVQSTDESWRECHLHARNLLGARDYAHLLVEQIERRAADGEDYFDLLTDRFTHELLGIDGYGTLLFEIRSRNVADEDSYWTTVTALRERGELDGNTYGQLLDKLHARGLLDDIGYRRRRGRKPPAPATEPLLRVAEPRTDHQAAKPPQDGQTDLFD